jgi:hypothetical protein
MIGYGNSVFLRTAWEVSGGVPPVNTVAPAITGTAQEGQTVTCSTGTWTGTPTITFAYQWKRNGSNIGSATNSTYTLVTADVSQSITCQVTATNGSGSASATSNTITPTAAVDPDAQAFITAAGITNPTQQSAIITLVTDLKGYSIWTKMKAIYPVVGGIASSHAVNLKTPGTYNLTFGTGWTHNANGMTSLNTFAQTNLQPSTVLGLNDSHLSYFTTGFGADGSATCMIGAFSSPNRLFLYAAGFYGVNTSSSSNYTYSGAGVKFRVISRLSSTVHKFANNGTIQTATVNSSARPTANIELARLGGFGADNFNGICKFASIGDGLTDTDIANFNTAVTTYQTALSRYN